MVDIAAWLQIDKVSGERIARLHQPAVNYNRDWWEFKPLILQESLVKVGHQIRYICPKEGPSVWSFCDEHEAALRKDSKMYEIREVFIKEE